MNGFCSKNVAVFLCRSANLVADFIRDAGLGHWPASADEHDGGFNMVDGFHGRGRLVSALRRATEGRLRRI